MAWERRKPGRLLLPQPAGRRPRGQGLLRPGGHRPAGGRPRRGGPRRRAEDAAALRTEQARLEALDRPPAALDRACTLLATAALTAGGYRRYNYGPWRRRRD